MPNVTNDSNGSVNNNNSENNDDSDDNDWHSVRLKQKCSSSNSDSIRCNGKTLRHLAATQVGSVR